MFQRKREVCEKLFTLRGDFGDLYGAAFLDGSADQEADASGRPGVGERERRGQRRGRANRRQESFEGETSVGLGAGSNRAGRARYGCGR